MSVRDAELNVLGTILLVDRVLDTLTVEEGLRPEHFSVPDHATAYQAMLTLADEGQPVDALTLTSRLGVPQALLDVAPAGAQITAYRQHARLIITEHRWRLRHHAALQQLERVAERDEHGYQAAADVREPDRAADALHSPERLAAGLEQHLDAERGNVLPTPFPALNAKLGGGLAPGQATTLAAWSSMGKTLIAAQFAEHLAGMGGRVGFYSNEMSPTEMAARLIAGHVTVPFTRIVGESRLNAHERDELRGAYRKLLFPIVDVAGWPVADICRHIRRSKWDLAVLDLFNRLPGRQRLQDVDAAVSSLCDAARVSGCHIIVCAQLNRGRDDKAIKPAPTARDLRETGSLEHAPANVMFVHREQQEIIDPITDESTGRVKRLNTGVVYFVKARNGDPDASVTVRLNPDRMRFEPMRTLEAAA